MGIDAPSAAWSIDGHPTEVELAAAVAALRLRAGSTEPEPESESTARGWPRRQWRRPPRGEES